MSISFKSRTRLDKGKAFHSHFSLFPVLCTIMEVFRSLFLALLILKMVAAQPATDPYEVAALKKVINHWNLGKKLNISGGGGSDPCNRNATWSLSDANPRIACECSKTVCHINQLKIYALDISGELPLELFMLKELTDLNLGQNVLNGTIPAEISQLSKMKYLSIGINNFTGPVPAELGNLTNLLSLSFSSNNFNGSLPKELGNLASLQQLYIDSSGVSGPIPQEFSNLKSLQIWWASDNQFTGKLPEFLGTLTDLEVLRLEGTGLKGPIPSSYSALTKLQDLRIGDLTGTDSSLDFLQNLTSLSILSLRNCQIAGKLPEKLTYLANLQTLDLSFNKLTGPIPNSFQDFTALKYLYLGSNNLSGELPPSIISSNLVALDVSFNSITGNLPLNGLEISMNIVGTSIDDKNSHGRKASAKLGCFQGNTKCSNDVSSTSFSVNCGGANQVSAAGLKYDEDSEVLGAASLYTSSNSQWAVSSSGVFISNPNGQEFIASTDTQITGTLDSEIYKTARVSPNSLRYYGLGLKNGKYEVELHFSEIQMEDFQSWKGLGRRLFDVYIQGEKVLEDFNIRKQAGGSKKAVVKTFEVNVTNTVMDIHFYWAGKGTCCIPFQSTYGPLVSAIHVSSVAVSLDSSDGSKNKHVGKIFGIAGGCAAGVVIILSIFYIWWTKKSPKHTLNNTDSPKKV